MNYADMQAQERQLYLQALVRVARADQALDEEELDFFHGVAKGMGIPEGEVEQLLAGEQPLTDIPRLHNGVGALILRDLAAMAVINNELHEAEEQEIFKIGEAMGFSKEEIDEFINWGFMGLQWQLTGLNLLKRYENPA